MITSENYYECCLQLDAMRKAALRDGATDKQMIAITLLDKMIKEFEKSFGQTFRPTGNYNSALKAWPRS